MIDRHRPQRTALRALPRATVARPPSRSDPHPASGGAEMTLVFAVVGEHREDPDRLLVLGEDGHHYDYRLPTGQALPTEPDEAWEVDPSAVEAAVEELNA